METNTAGDYYCRDCGQLVRGVHNCSNFKNEPKYYTIDKKQEIVELLKEIRDLLKEINYNTTHLR